MSQNLKNPLNRTMAGSYFADFRTIITIEWVKQVAGPPLQANFMVEAVADKSPSP